MKAPDVMEMESATVEEMEPMQAKTDPRVALEWDEEDAEAIEFIKGEIEKLMAREFSQVRNSMERLMEKVRVPYPDGTPGYVTDQDGVPLLDWDSMSYRELESFAIESKVVSYAVQSKLSDKYIDAVFAKFTYDDAYDKAYTSQLSGTIGDKTAKAKRRTMDERWRALFRSLYHKRAQAEIDKYESLSRTVDRIRADRVKVHELEFRASMA